jgi:hypothetical protein
MFYVGDGVTYGGVSVVQRTFPNRGVMIKGTSAESFLVAPGDPVSQYLASLWTSSFDITASATAPINARDGAFWLDTSNTKFGIFEWNSATTGAGGQVFTVKYPTVITNANQLVASNVENAPLPSVGSIGDYVIVATTTLYRLYFKKALTNTAAGTWVKVGSPEWYASWPIVQSGTVSSITSNNVLTINGKSITSVTTLQGLVDAINNYPGGLTGVFAAKINNKLELYSDGTSKSNGSVVDGAIYLEGTMLTELGLTTNKYLGTALAIQNQTGTTPVTTFSRTYNSTSANGIATGAVWVKASSGNLGAEWIIKQYSSATSTWTAQSVALYPNGQSALAALDQTGGGLNLTLGRIYVKYNDSERVPSQSDFKIYVRRDINATNIKSVKVLGNTFIPGTNNFTIAESLVGNSSLSSPKTIEFTAGPDALTNIYALLNAVTAAGFVNITSVKNSDYSITISHATGGDFRLADGLNLPLSKLFSVDNLSTVDKTVNLYADPNSGSGANYQFLVYSKLNGRYEFSSITASGVAITNLTLTGTNGLTLTRTDTSPPQVNPTISTTGQVSFGVDPVPFKTAISLQNVTNESKATMFTSPTFTGHPTIEGVTATGATGTGNLVFSASPTFTGTVSGISASMVGLGNVTNESKTTMFASPTFTGTVAGVTAAMVGLGNVTNESKATMFTSPTFTGTITGTLNKTFTVNGVAFNNSADVTATITGSTGPTGPAGPSTYDLFNFVNGKPLATEVLMRAITVRIYTIAANFAGSLAYCTTGPTTAQTINILKNGATIGTITFGIASTSGTFAGSPSGVTMNIGDQLQLQLASGASQDATFSDVAFTIKGTSS